MAEYRFTSYFDERVLPRRPYLRRGYCIQVIENPVRVEAQERNRWRFWGRVPALGNRYLRVITLEDKVTIHNAFIDGRFKP